jgi:integrase
VAYKGLRKSTIRDTKAEARTAEADLLQELKAKVGQAAQQAETPATLRGLFESYAENLEARGKSTDTIGRAVEMARAFERLMPDLIDRPVSKIKEADIFAFRKARAETSLSAIALKEHAEVLRRDGKPDQADAFERKAVDRQRKGTKPSTINRDLRTLRAMLKRAVPDFRFPAGAFFQDDETRVRWLRPEQELLVLEAMRSPFREIAKLAALTLMRLSEIRLLRHDDVHLEQGVILLPKAKTGARPVVLGADAQKILGKQLEANLDGEWVFPGPDGRPYDRSYIGRVFRRAARQAGLRDFHFHDLRHHGATMALNRGFPRIRKINRVNSLVIFVSESLPNFIDAVRGWK